MSQQPLIVFTGGGSGGHVFPAFAVIDRLGMNARILWIGSRRGIEADIVARRGIDFRGISAGKLRRYISLKNCIDFFRFLAGIGESLVLLARFRPALVFSKGGFVSVPPVIAAYILKIPVVCHESDYDPGLATRICALFCSALCIPYEESLRFYRRNSRNSRKTVVVTGNPVRSDVLKGSRRAAFAMTGFSSTLPVLLIQGGSLGARQINTFVKNNIIRLLESAQVIHQTGDSSWELEVPARLRSRYFSRSFFSNTYSDILKISDIVISRAGAGTVWELGLAAKPAVFIPLTAGSRGDQLRNARYVEGHGAALVCESEEGLENLAERVTALLADLPKQRAMAAAWKTIVHNEGAERVARVIRKILASEKNVHRNFPPDPMAEIPKKEGKIESS